MYMYVYIYKSHIYKLYINYIYIYKLPKKEQ